MSTISFLGAGSWGMALAKVVANNGHKVCMWSENRNKIEELTQTSKCKVLDGLVMPAGILYTTDLETACRASDFIVFAVPSNAIKDVAYMAKPFIRDSQIIINVSKGIDRLTLQTLSEVICESLGTDFRNHVSISGPTHAEELSKDIPSAAMVGCKNLDNAEKVKALFTNMFFKLYVTTDIRGMEICGALKNVLALATGASAGLGYGDNTRAAIITQGISEIAFLGRKLRCKHSTFSGLAGMGDAIVTCTSMHSRNFQCGLLVGQGMEVNDAIKQVGMVVEGVNVLPAVDKLQQKYELKMPICGTVADVILRNVPIQDAVKALLQQTNSSEDAPYTKQWLR